MNSIRVAIILAAVGLLMCLWLLAGVAWYNFMAFMLLAQPLMLLALVIFVMAVVREVRRRDAAMARTERSGGAP
jgi:hypothetical protein